MSLSNLIPSSTFSLRNLTILSLVASLLGGCASQASMSSTYGGHPTARAAAPESAGSYEASNADSASGYGRAQPGAPSSTTTSPAASPAKAGVDKSASEVAPQPSERPGLATHWGENRSSPISSTTFTRANSDSPMAVASLWYNDREGARASASSEGYRTMTRGGIEMAQGGVTVSLRDDGGSVLPGYAAGGKVFAIGEASKRYTIVVSNNTPARFEVVASVDGLDVLDGQNASFSKRGYIVRPNSTLEIDGFRRSESTVAAFRFGDVRGSYAGKKGDDRNVGVIGIAVFHESGTQPWPWNPGEVERRRNADPFPGRFAEPPQ